MPYTKEEIEDKLRKSLDASYVVRFVVCCFTQLNYIVVLVVCLCVTRQPEI